MTDPRDEDGLKEAMGLNSLEGINRTELERIFQDVLPHLPASQRDLALDIVPGLREIGLEGIEILEAEVDDDLAEGEPSEDDDHRLFHDALADARVYYGNELAREDTSEEYRLRVLSHIADSTRREQEALTEQRAHKAAEQAADRKSQLIRHAMDRGVPLAIQLAKIGLQIAATRGLPK